VGVWRGGGEGIGVKNFEKGKDDVLNQKDLEMVTTDDDHIPKKQIFLIGSPIYSFFLGIHLVPSLKIPSFFSALSLSHREKNTVSSSFFFFRQTFLGELCVVSCVCVFATGVV